MRNCTVLQFNLNGRFLWLVHMLPRQIRANHVFIPSPAHFIPVWFICTLSSVVHTVHCIFLLCDSLITCCTSRRYRSRLWSFRHAHTHRPPESPVTTTSLKSTYCLTCALLIQHTVPWTRVSLRLPSLTLWSRIVSLSPGLLVLSGIRFISLCSATIFVVWIFILQSQRSRMGSRTKRGRRDEQRKEKKCQRENHVNNEVEFCAPLKLFRREAGV